MTTNPCRVVIRGVLILAVVVSLVVLSLEWKRRHDLYWYDVRQDYSYAFESEPPVEVATHLSKNGFDFPGIDGNWDTALLPIKVETTWSSYWFEPSIEIRTDETSWTQTFERGARGLRYLILHQDAIQPGEKVYMEGKHIRWPDQERQLLLFSNPGVTRAKLLVLAPHPDDAEIAAFGLYSNTDSYVATISAGNYVDGLYAHLSDDTSVQDTLRGRLRTWDSLVVPTWGGVDPTRIVNLGYWNGSLTYLYRRRFAGAVPAAIARQNPNSFRSGAVAELLGGRVATATWRSLVEDLRVLMEAVDPELIVAPHPAIDAAEDHRFTTLALLEALEENGDRVTPLLLYTNHHFLSEYYPFGPMHSAVTLPPVFDGKGVMTGVYSQWLSEHDRMDKLFALEAMHDLRAAPRELTGGPTERFITLAAAAVDGLVRNPLGTYSYFRRSVRVNELFFVVQPADRERLRKASESSQ